MNMQLVTTAEYYPELLRAVAQARQRIVLAAMVVLADERTTPILQAIVAASKRGVKVCILHDVYSQTWFSTSHVSRRERPQLVASTRAMLAQLARAGAEIIEYGTIGRNPFKGRCHIKITVVDDVAYTFGGVNFAAPHFDHTDYMFRIAQKTLADKLEAIVHNTVKTRENIEWPIDTANTLLFDGGQPKQSVIYDRACELAASAKHIYYISQMAPSGRLARLLQQTESDCYFNRPSVGSPVLTASLLIDQMRGTVKNLYKHQRYIHAKFILFELKDGSKALVSGSNNFSWRGVAYGTQEIALMSTDDGLWQQLHVFMERYLI